ncbi:polysaccharide biosynthesis protein [Acetanaerobacterium elongatum]|uniref:NDP-sugar epimerase, includes UDP-GlcNAc-inverting 4,6-dehydratase FlaA1 and capsular polysaccharide biosynthesis protein EpsC n=1 Tax=Acetanaerobacterium elongatum TaxID=258515 RepID=A0A1G9WKJ8_9FIRM|nr:nucleoside-diphosphate sugar epimerase/dehydratase [Acetanaerobacterium elongatum]SDM84763.1 NDP-sugar epimerase, includes UDP-GlcNAc-inverting 4,6-dehydratase FlaA1 and capsular polysaccharide biosynthesis protein EpsC [Acetanaerobacterium elongatum]
MSTRAKTLRLKLVLAFLDLLCAYVSVVTGFKLKFGFLGTVPTHYIENTNFYILAVYIFVLLYNIAFKVYSTQRQSIDFAHITSLVPSVALVLVSLLVFDRALRLGMPIEMMIIICALLLFFMLLCRIGIKGLRFILVRYESLHAKELRRVLIYPAGEMGRYLCDKLLSNPAEPRVPVAFIDDNKALHGKRFNGVKVVGGFKSLGLTLRSHSVDEVIIALPGADAELVKRIVTVCRQQRVEVSRFGTIENIDDSPEKASISDIKLDDLLRRDRVHLNMNAVRRFIEGKTVLVTGGAGSIGSEICRQALTYGAKKLIVFDFDENGLFDIGNELGASFSESRFELRIGSVRDKVRLNELFREFKVEVVFHAAAHKHVPMMELNPVEAVKNNVFGTLNVAQTASRFNCERFILISTDKAVNPGNVMGASKRIAEQAIQMLNAVSNTVFAAVRFGNVLGSSGSVVPFFVKQIESGGPVTVTHPEMRRYFMTIPEAVQLVLEAGSLAKGGEIFVLDMGEPVRIYDLACDLIMLYGLKPNTDIKIEFCGLRPGEKLFEEIRLAEEDVSKTDNNKIYVLKPVEFDFHTFADEVKQLERCCSTYRQKELFEHMKRLVPTFNHQ